jgi:putative ABC transport system substrate-binding protein
VRAAAVIAALGAVALQIAEAQPGPSVPRVGVLGAAVPGDSPYAHAFREALGRLGYTEGQNILIVWRSAGGRYERLPDLAAELIRLKVDVIVTESTAATLATQRTGAAIPIVMAIVADPVGSGLVESLARPGGQITGLSLMMTDVVAKRLELLKEVVPRAQRLAVLGNPDTPWYYGTAVRELRIAARLLRVQPVFVEARAPGALESAFAAIRRARADGLQVVGDPVLFSHRSRLLELIARHRLPAIFEEREYVLEGGLMAWGPNFSHAFQRAAWYVDRILKGVSPAELPVEQPMRFELAVNLRTAKALGLTIPESVLLRADTITR